MITNRTQTNVDSITKDATSVNRGAYNYTDLNRVENKVKELNELLIADGYMSQTLTTKLDWALTDKFSSSDMQRYLNNIQEIRTALTSLTSTPYTPTTMNYMSFETANNIEKILVDIEMLIRGMENYYVYSGVANAGQQRFYQNRFRHFHPHALESTGTQYIDTDIKSQVEIKVEMEFEFTTNATASMSPFGSHYNSPNLNFQRTSGATPFWYTVFDGEQTTNTHFIVQTNTPYKAELYMGASEQYFKVNGETIYSAENVVTGVSAKNLYLFERNASYPYPASMKLYYCKIWLNDELVRDFVPSVTNGTPCLYDNVTQTSFYNAGTGDFIYN